MTVDNIYNRKKSRRNIFFLGIGMMLASVLAIYFFYDSGFATIVLAIITPLYFLFTYRFPTLIVYALLFYSFAIFFVSRYLLRDIFPAGTIYDVMLILGYLAVWMAKGNKKRVEWERIKDAPFWILLGWLAYCMFSIVLPEFPGFNAWMLSFRVHFYMAFSIPLFILLLDAKSIKTIIVLWAVFSIIISLKGIVQLYNFNTGGGIPGLSLADQGFLQGNKFHILGGKLRVFSFLSDAGQFGVQQAHAATTGLLLLLSAKNGKQRLLYIILALAGLYGLFVSGTRGAVFVLFGGAFAYCFWIRKIKLLILAIVLAGGFYGFMSYTYIGNNVYAIHRMRTAFKPDQDASYIARKINQETLKVYLASRPFGGGLGSMQHGHEGTVLKDTPFDSGYVLVWGDQGIVGLCLYIGMIIFFLLKGTYVLWFQIKNEWLRSILIAMMSGLAGVAVANYGNPVMVQHPTCVMYFLIVAVIYAAPRIDKSLQPQEETVAPKPTSVSTRLTKFRVTTI